MLAGAAGVVTRLVLAGGPNPVVLLGAGGAIGGVYLALAAALGLPELAQLRRLLGVGGR
jgi:hypothetical protein